MKILDLYESEFKDELNGEIMNVLMMIMKTSVPETDIENVIAELEKQGKVVNKQDVEDFINSNDNFSLSSSGEVVFSDIATDTVGDDRPDLETEDEYNPAIDKAKQATKKRSK